jgi:hypothetical protein
VKLYTVVYVHEPNYTVLCQYDEGDVMPVCGDLNGVTRRGRRVVVVAKVDIRFLRLYMYYLDSNTFGRETTLSTNMSWSSRTVSLVKIQ